MRTWERITALILAWLVAMPAFGSIDIRGQLKNAQLEKLASDPTGSEARIYYNTTDDVARYYAGGSWKTLLDSSSSLTSVNVTNYIDMTEVTSPASPDSGSLRIFAKSDDKLYTLNSDGIEQAVGSGSGQGKKNYITNPSGATDNSDWSQTGTAGISRVTTGLPRGTTTGTGLKFSGGSAGDYLQTCFTIDAADHSKKLGFNWAQAPGSGYAAGDWKAEAYTFTAADCGGTATALTINQASDGNSYYEIPNATGDIDLSFDTTTADYYGVRFTRVANATDLVGSDVTVTPDRNTVVGAAVGPTTLYTPDFGAGLGTPTNVVVTYQQSGDKMIIEGSFNAGTVSSSTVSISLPSGTTMDSTMLGAGSRGSVGKYWASTTSAATFIEASGNSGALFFDGTDTANLYFGNKTSADGSSFAKTSGTGILGDGGLVSFFAIVPISEWADSTVNLGASGCEYAYNTSTSTSSTDTTSFGYGESGAKIQDITAALSRTVRFKTPFQRGDQPTIQISADQEHWVDVDGYQVTPDGNYQVSSFMIQNSATYGVGRPYFNNSTDVVVGFGAFALANGASFGADGQDWSDGAGSYYWRVKKCSADQATGFAEVIPGKSSGLVSANGLKGSTDGSSAPAGYVGEYKYSTDTAVLSSSTHANASGTITLTPGMWLVVGNGMFGINTSASASDMRAYLVVDGTNGSTYGIDAQTSQGSTGTSLNFAGFPLTKPVYVSAGSTYDVYYDMWAGTVTGSVQGIGSIQAIRIR